MFITGQTGGSRKCVRRTRFGEPSDKVAQLSELTAFRRRPSREPAETHPTTRQKNHRAGRTQSIRRTERQSRSALRADRAQASAVPQARGSVTPQRGKKTIGPDRTQSVRRTERQSRSALRADRAQASAVPRARRNAPHNAAEKTSGRIVRNRFGEPSDKVAQLSELTALRRRPSREPAEASPHNAAEKPSGRIVRNRFGEPSDKVAQLSELIAIRRRSCREPAETHPTTRQKNHRAGRTHSVRRTEQQSLRAGRVRVRSSRRTRPQSRRSPASPPPGSNQVLRHPIKCPTLPRRMRGSRYPFCRVRLGVFPRRFP
ncbi:hypothetical protein CA85_47640 [Allorhodopirellula solitaria]|uniref:Uncharacterized protein n=1 Tax=Allorhodopirellula solitaria TaxID=2527987 RepID=A0A5C5WYZ9_9BACT|nr:hypothetical protein CA85_47640 [Allorhodopirellula solitaria]